MDLPTAVAASMLPASRARIAAAFRDLQHESLSGAPFLELLWSACGRDTTLPSTTALGLLDEAARALEDGRKMGIEARGGFDPGYPALLACIPDPPPVLWARGKPRHSGRPTVALIGSRAATPYALEVGSRIAAELAAAWRGRGERAGARRRFGGAPGVPWCRRHDSGSAGMRARSRLSAGARRTGRADRRERPG